MFDFLNVIDIELDTKPIDTSNWQRVFFDLEGSLTAQKGDILQLAAITTDWDFNITDVFNMYFKNNKPIGQKEYSIHGISESFLAEADTKHFTELLHLMPFNPSKPTMFISYTTFDVRRVNEELQAYGIDPIDFGEQKYDLAYNLSDNKNCHFDAYRYGKRNGVQSSAELGEDVFNSIYTELSSFGTFDRKTNHDALYDTVMILALCRRLTSEQPNRRNY